MADLNSILYGQPGTNAFPGVPQVPQGVLQQSSVPPEAPPPQLPAGALQGQIQQPAPQAPQSPAESPGMLDGFSSLVDRVRSDPAMAQAAMMAGIRLAQGARPGQSVLGLLGDTAQMGMTAYQMLEGNKRTQGMQDTEFKNKQEAQQATTQGQQLQNAEAQATLPAMIKAKIAKAGMLERAGKVDEAESVVAQLRADYRKTVATNPGSAQFERAWSQEIDNQGLTDSLKQQLLQAQTANAYASAGASGASAENSSAHAGLARAQTENPERFRNQPQSAVNAQWQELRDSYKLTNPEATPQQIEEMARKAMVKSTLDAKNFDARNKLAQGLIDQKLNPTEADIAAAYAMADRQFPSGGPAVAGGGRSSSGAIGGTGGGGKTINAADVSAMIQRYPDKKLTPEQVIKDAAAKGYKYTP